MTGFNCAVHFVIVLLAVTCSAQVVEHQANRLCYCNPDCPDQDQTNIARVEEQLVALHRNTTTVQQQMMAVQQQMIAELHTQRRMISGLEAKIAAINSTVVTLETRSRPKDCAEVQQQGHSQSWVYEVFVGPREKPVQVFCDLDHQGGGWLVFQRREDGSQDFQQNWNMYARGFGDLFGEFWLGNDFLHLITQQKQYRLRIDLEDFENGTKYAEYSTMAVAAASDKYRLLLGSYSGNAGDAMTFHSVQFSTIDQDNDGFSSGSCSSQRGKGGWWYNSCHYANLNELYLGGEDTARANGVIWMQWRGYEYSLKKTVMKIRPSNY